MAFAGGMDRVVHVNPALRILHHTVRVAVFDAGGKFSPIVDGFVGVAARAEDRQLGAGLIVGTQDGGRDDAGGLEESSAGGAHEGEYTTT